MEQNGKMMKQFYLFYFALNLLLAAGCTSGGKQDEQVAREICDCMQPLYESYTSIKDAREDNDTESLQRFVEEMEAVNDEVSACANRIQERYGALEGEREERVKAAMQNVCPEIIATLNEAENALVQ